MPVTKQKPVVRSPFSSTAVYNPVISGAITVMFPEMSGAITVTALPLVGETSVTSLPEYGAVSTTYPLGQRDES